VWRGEVSAGGGLRLGDFRRSQRDGFGEPFFVHGHRVVILLVLELESEAFGRFLVRDPSSAGPAGGDGAESVLLDVVPEKRDRDRLTVAFEGGEDAAFAMVDVPPSKVADCGVLLRGNLTELREDLLLLDGRGE
jgi:hypothetical protein